MSDSKELFIPRNLAQAPIGFTTQILVVDDEDVLRGVIAELLRRQGHEVEEASFGEDALQKFQEGEFRIVITDIIMGKMNGIELLKEIRKIDPDCPVIVMTSNASMETAIQALREGAYDYLVKPFEELEFILATVNRALNQLKLQHQNRNLVETLKTYTKELERASARFKSQADRDGLTDLYNHRYFRETLERELIRGLRENKPVSLIIIDLDHFKVYNDSNGHLAGDELLRQCGMILKEAVRGSDIVARYGGEEFVLVLPHAGQEHAAALAERIREQIATYPFEGKASQPGGTLTASFGVASFPQDAQNANDLISLADRALYRAKEQGRNAVALVA